MLERLTFYRDGWGGRSEEICGAKFTDKDGTVTYLVPVSGNKYDSESEPFIQFLDQEDFDFEYTLGGDND